MQMQIHNRYKSNQIRKYLWKVIAKNTQFLVNKNYFGQPETLVSLDPSIFSKISHIPFNISTHYPLLSCNIIKTNCFALDSGMNVLNWHPLPTSIPLAINSTIHSPTGSSPQNCTAMNVHFSLWYTVFPYFTSDIFVSKPTLVFIGETRLITMFEMLLQLSTTSSCTCSRWRTWLWLSWQPLLAILYSVVYILPVAKLQNKTKPI